MTAVSLWLPRFAADVARRRLPVDPPPRAVVLSVVDRGREVVAACCAAAARAGVAPGLTLSHARALLPGGVHAEPYDAARTGRALRRLAAWATRFTPVVALDEPDGLLLDASGCERLYGGSGAIVERVLARVRGLGLAAREQRPHRRPAARYPPHHRPAGGPRGGADRVQAAARVGRFVRGDGRATVGDHERRVPARAPGRGRGGRRRRPARDQRGERGGRERGLPRPCSAHNPLMLGPAGTGKTMMAKALPGVLPPLLADEAIEITRVYSA
ncbi:MAG: ATP-binding protein, partial [Phycisphaerales bacterium]